MSAGLKLKALDVLVLPAAAHLDSVPIDSETFLKPPAAPSSDLPACSAWSTQTGLGVAAGHVHANTTCHTRSAGGV